MALKLKEFIKMPPTNPPVDQPPTPPTVAPPPPLFSPDPAPVGPAAHPKSSFVQKLGGPKARLLVFALVFAGIGGYFIFHSFAASFSNESKLVSAIRNLNGRSYEVQTNMSVTYNGVTRLKSALVNATTDVSKYENSFTNGTITLNQSGSPASAQFPFQALNFYNELAFNLRKIDKLETLLPTGSHLRGWLSSHQNSLGRLQDNFYMLTADYSSSNAPDDTGLGCLANTPLIPDYKDLGTLSSAYGKTPVLNITPSNSATGTVTYTITPNNINLQAFLDNVSNTGYISKLNKCARLLVHSRVTDKLFGAAAFAGLKATVSVNNQNQITQATFTNSSGKALVNLVAKFNYKRIDLPTLPNIGDFDAYYYYLNHPTVNGQDNKFFSYQLPKGWGVDYCRDYGQESIGQALYPDGPSKGPYCGASKGWLAVDRQVFDSASSSAPDRQAKVKAAARSKAQQPPSADTLASTTGACKKSEEATTVTIDGKKVSRDVLTYGNCDKWIVYDYFQEDTAGSKITDTDFWGSYFQSHKLADQTAAFDNMVQAVHFKY